MATAVRAMTPAEVSVMILAIDPGIKSPYYAWADPTQCVLRNTGRVPIKRHTPAITGISYELPDLEFDWAVVEGQFAARRSGKQMLIQLCFNAGFRLGCVYADEKYRVPPEDWKSELFRGGGHMKKEVFTRRLEHNCTPAELAMLPEGNARSDALDAIGILWASYLMYGTALDKFSYGI